MGSPIIPLLAHVLLVPLIEAIGLMGAQQITTEVLDRVSQHLRGDLLDIIGVSSGYEWHPSGDRVDLGGPGH